MRNSGSQGTVMLVEDDPQLRQATLDALELANLDVEPFECADRAARYLSPGFAGCIVTDIRMEGMDGLQLFARISALDPEIPVILITGHGDVSMAVRAMQDGAFDFLTKPFSTDHLIAVIRKALLSRQLVLDNRALRKAVAEPDDEMIARSRSMEHFRSIMTQLARTEIDVLIHGEAGAGKELWARQLHKQSARYSGPFVVLAGIVSQSDQDILTAVAQAEGGTLFVDSYNSLPAPRQVQLAALLDKRDRHNVNDSGRQGFRLILSATTTNSDDTIVTELDRRVGPVRLRVPPLRERRDDIAPLFARFVSEALPQVGKKRFEMSAADRKRLLEYDWPGNVRELRNFAFAAVLNLPRQKIGSNREIPNNGMSARVAEFERMVICEALEAARGNVVRTCAQLKTPRKTLYEKLAKHGIDPSNYRQGPSAGGSHSDSA